MKRAVLYARHSTDKQNESSTADQLALCRRYCDAQEIEVVAEFYDEALSGSSTEGRAGFQRLLAFIDQHSDSVRGALPFFNVVICEDLSRLSRNIADLAQFYNRLQFLGIELVSINDGLTDNIAIGFKGTMNTIMLENLSKMTKRGQIASVMKGKAPGGQKYGYERIFKCDERGKVERGLLRIKEEEAKIIRWVFDEFANGKKLFQIYGSLNEKKVPSPSGVVGGWTHQNFNAGGRRRNGILRSTMYKGIITFNRVSLKKNPETGRRLSFTQPEEKWITVEAPELQIVSTEVFEEVQKILNFKQKPTERPSSLIKRTAKKKAAKIVRQEQGAYHKLENRQNRFILFSQRTFCKRHKDKIKAIRAGLYSCPRKGCRSKALDYMEVTRAVLQSMQNLTVEEMEQYENRMTTETKEQQEKIRQINEKIQPITNKLKDIYLHQSGKPGQTLVELVNQLERDRDDLRWHLKNSEKTLKIYHCATDKKRARTLKKFKNAIQKALDDSDHVQSLVNLKKCLARADLETVGGNIYCTTTINFEGLYTIYNA